MKIEINLTKFDCDSTIVINTQDLENQSKLTNKIEDSVNDKSKDVDFIETPDLDVRMFVTAMSPINVTKDNITNKVITEKQLSPLITYQYDIKKKFFDLGKKIASIIYLHYDAIIENGAFYYDSEEFFIKINHFGLIEIYRIVYGTHKYLFSTNCDMLIDDLNKFLGIDDDDI